MASKSIWRRTLVYFGIAEDEEPYDEETLSSSEDSEPSYGERPTVKKVERVGRGNSRRRSSSGDFDDIFSDEANFRTQRSNVIRPVPVPTPVERGPVKVHLVVPKNFNDAQLIADKFKSEIPVILNLQACDTELSKRLIDFASGLTYALDGGIERVADKVFLLTPKNVEVSAEEKQRLIEKGFFNQF
jgi:cell division inhibitor SepF